MCSVVRSHHLFSFLPIRPYVAVAYLGRGVVPMRVIFGQSMTIAPRLAEDA